jgi:hypothetical protein
MGSRFFCVFLSSASNLETGGLGEIESVGKRTILESKADTQIEPQREKQGSIGRINKGEVVLRYINNSSSHRNPTLNCFIVSSLIIAV